MKGKRLLASLAMVISMLLACSVGTGYAAVGGVCSECHTMHNSQGGAAMGTTDPQSALLLDDCLGCHTGTDDPLGANGYPYVKSSSSLFSDDVCLAGGFFPVSMGTGNNNDDHHGIGNTNDPAGYSDAENDWYTGGTSGDSDGLGCAGTNGCHGNETDLDDMAAISGGHHNPSGYRILSVDGIDVLGYGAKDYEEAIIDNPNTAVVTSGDTQNVNIYSAGVEDPSISELCAKCHGDFHNENGSTDDVGSSGTSWIRHPTDVDIPTTWAIGSTDYTPDGEDYKHNPVGYDDASFDITGKMATCLSCHRAHGTENADLLRWAYTTQNAGSGDTYGCLGCHDKQR